MARLSSIPLGPVTILDTNWLVRELAVHWPDEKDCGFVDIALSATGELGQPLLDLLASWGYTPPEDGKEEGG